MGTNIKEEFSESKDYVVKTEEFEDLSETMLEGIGNDKKPLEDALLADPDNCAMCGWVDYWHFCIKCAILTLYFYFSGALVIPRMLHCLHVFCEDCLDKKLVCDGAGDAGSRDTSVTCPTCSYSTLVSAYLLLLLNCLYCIIMCKVV